MNFGAGQKRFGSEGSRTHVLHDPVVCPSKLKRDSEIEIHDYSRRHEQKTF